jgi:hypothetical protein
MVVFRPDLADVPAADALAHVRSMTEELAVLCVGAGRPDAAMGLLQVVLMLQRPLLLQPPDANAAPGDAA